MTNFRCPVRNTSARSAARHFSVICFFLSCANRSTRSSLSAFPARTAEKDNQSNPVSPPLHATPGGGVQPFFSHFLANFWRPLAWDTHLICTPPNPINHKGDMHPVRITLGHCNATTLAVVYFLYLTTSLVRSEHFKLSKRAST